MCDTMVVLGNATGDGSVFFAKNSDREPNEAHEVVIIPAADHPTNARVRCTYIEVPQVSHTYAVLLAKPFWIWGAEMGANEHGVVIGNEAVFTRVPHQKENGLIGMDFIRLALERSRNAEEALHCITGLLEEYGQGGNCGFRHRMVYHNSFILADAREAWVLETAGKFWAAEKVKDIRSISNALTIGEKWDMASPGLVEHAIKQGWCQTKTDFHFARCYSDWLYTRFSDARRRQKCSTDLLSIKRGKITEKTMFAVLRSHAGIGEEERRIDRGLTGSEICMHAGFGPVRGSQSVGSMVSRLTSNGATHWLTGTSAPCLSIFKPVWIDSGFPEEIIGHPQGTFDESTLFWRHEILHRTVLRNYPERGRLFMLERNNLEDEFIFQEMEKRSQSEMDRKAFTEECFHRSQIAEQNWLERVLKVPARGLDLFYAQAWKRFNREAGLSAFVG